MTRISLMIMAVVAMDQALAQPPDPPQHDEALALMRGVENARKQITSGHLTISVLIEHPSTPKYGSDEFQLDVVFDGTNRRYKQKRRVLATIGNNSEERNKNADKFVLMDGDRDAFVKQGFGKWVQDEVTLIFKGDTVASNESSELVARLRSPGKVSEIAFDPRILGLSTFPVARATIEGCLPYRRASRITLVDEDPRQTQLRHVRLTAPNGTVNDYWIGQGFAVVKIDSYNESLKRRRVVSAEYNPKGGPIPGRSSYETFLKGQLKHRMIVTCSDVQLNIPTDQSMFDLTALNLKKGRTVIDEQSNKVRYWDGKKVVDDPPHMDRPTKEPDSSASRRRFITIGVLSTVVVIAVLIWRRRRRSSKTPENVA